MSYSALPSTQKLRTLLEMRPALDGFAGIPQETRLLFRAFCDSQSIDITGLLQTSLRFLIAGTPRELKTRATTREPDSKRYDRYSRLIVSLDTKPSGKLFDEIRLYLKRRRVAYRLMLSAVLGGNRRLVELTKFEPRHFEEYVWHALFEKTLPSEDFGTVTSRDHLVCQVPWNILQSAGLLTRKWRRRPVYPTIDTSGIDIFVAQTPYPGRVTKNTKLVIRYHDALPIFMPHAFANKARHQATHFQALADNVASGAYFACVSETTRQALVTVFPETEARSVTIHNMVSHHYFCEDSSASRVAQIIRARRNVIVHDGVNTPQSCDTPDAAGMKYLLVVSTIEPRKNHSLLISAFAALRAEYDSALKLVIVGSNGWGADQIVRDMRPWIEQGALFALDRVSASELRVLYRHAAVTVCPSLAEGFDFSGVEAMRSGGAVVASDIAVHREVYGDAAEYFDSHSDTDLKACLLRMFADENASARRKTMIERGASISERYLPETILPKWEAFLTQVGRQ